MKILKINPNKPERELLKLAAGTLENKGLVVTPTDTLYALSASALDKESIKKVYKAKGRDFKKPLSIMFYSLSQARKYVKFTSLALKLAEKFLPGPLTIILPMKRNFPKELTGSNKVGIRIPDNRISQGLIKLCRFPITATSANISGNSDSVTAEDALNQVGDEVDLILDGGKCRLKKPSTVVEIIDDEIRVIREGAIKKSELKI